MTTAKFKVYSGSRVYDGARAATVTINRDNNLMNVRPLRRHRSYEIRLEDVAQIVIERIIKAELAEKKRAKAAKRKFR